MQHSNKRIRWSLIMVMLLFVVPFLLAILLFKFHEKIPFKYTHTGQLITPPVSLKPLDLPLLSAQKVAQRSGKWQLIYLAPKHCDATCLKRLEMLKRIHQALGKDQQRVSLQSLPLNEVFSAFGTEGAVLMVDPKGFVIMVYPKTPLNPKGMLQDLRRLLRFSHAT